MAGVARCCPGLRWAVEISATGIRKPRGLLKIRRKQCLFMAATWKKSRTSVGVRCRKLCRKSLCTLRHAFPFLRDEKSNGVAETVGSSFPLNADSNGKERGRNRVLSVPIKRRPYDKR